VIFTASYHASQNHHGQLFGISLSTPKGFRLAGELDFFKPCWDMLTLWKESKQDDTAWAEYEAQYWALLKTREAEVKAWLGSLNRSRPLPHMTLLCHEKSDRHCHRRLAAKVIEKYRPELWGGRDVPQFQVGDRVQWTQIPPHIEQVIVNDLPIKAIEGDAARLPWLGVPIPLSELRHAPIPDSPVSVYTTADVYGERCKEKAA
jgi:uncharacterized protein YeaO (DUF488 family)